jgi:hypothetical protein
MFKRLLGQLGLTASPGESSTRGGTVTTARPAPPPPHLIERINRNGDINDPATPRPLLMLEEFFDGNYDYGSIGCNFHQDQPATAEFYELFRQIRDRPDVETVLVQVSQHDSPVEWPFTDTVWIITSAAPATVSDWPGKRFAADELVTGWDEMAICWPEGEEAEVQALEPYTVPAGMRPIGVFWD